MCLGDQLLLFTLIQLNSILFLENIQMLQLSIARVQMAWGQASVADAVAEYLTPLLSDGEEWNSDKAEQIVIGS